MVPKKQRRRLRTNVSESTDHTYKYSFNFTCSAIPDISCMIVFSEVSQSKGIGHIPSTWSDVLIGNHFYQLSRHVLVQSQKWKNVRNLLKVNSSGVFIINLEHVLLIVLMFPLLPLKK